MFWNGSKLRKKSFLSNYKCIFYPFWLKNFTKPYFKHPSNTNCSIIFNCTFFYNKNYGTHSLLEVDHAKACIVAFRAEKEMECSTNSIELFEKEPSLVHHINRLETWDTGKTHPNKNWLSYLFTHYKRNWNSLIQCFLVNVASSITLNWKQFKVHLFNSSCRSGNGKEYWIRWALAHRSAIFLWLPNQNKKSSGTTN